MSARYARGILAVAGLCAATVLRGQAGGLLQIVTDSLPQASLSTFYIAQLNTTGGVCTGAGVATGAIDDGTLPPGLIITSPPSAKQWFLQGTPSAGGNFRFTIRVRWTHTGVSPFDRDCVDEAVKTLTLSVQGTVTVPTPLTIDRTQISTSYHTGQFPPAPDTVRVSSGGGVTVPFSAQSVTDSGGAWLSVSPQSAVTPAAISINYSISGLQPGTYTGRVMVASSNSNPLIIPVTLRVVTDSITLQTSPSTFSFSSIFGGPDPSSQSLSVTVSGADVIFQADVSAPPNGKWLTVSPSAAGTPSRITVAVIPKDLAAGIYSGTITLRVSGVPNSSQTIPVTFTIQPPAERPAITSNGVVNAAGLGNAIAPGTWVSIFGNFLSLTTRPWRDVDFQNSRLPTALDGVSVTINVLAPDDTATGLAPVQVKNSAGTSDTAFALLQTAAPALFQFNPAVARLPAANYAAGVHADGSYLAGPALVQQGIPGTPAKPGETIVLFGTGFGNTQPLISATALVPAALPLARPEDLHLRIGGLDAAIVFAGLISPGVYQFNVVVPQIDDGDKPVVAELRGLLTRPDLLLPVQH